MSDTRTETHPYQRGPAELLEAGAIRGRSVVSRHGITSPKALELAARFGSMIDAARETRRTPTDHN